MCPRSTLGTISKCQPWKHSKVRSISEKSDATKQLPSCRIHTIEGYAFAGSEHISMLVINDNPIKVQLYPNEEININIHKIVDSFAFAGLKHVKFLLLSSSVKHLHVVRSEEEDDHHHDNDDQGLEHDDHYNDDQGLEYDDHQDAFNGLESVEHLKLDFLNLNNTVAHTFRGLQANKIYKLFLPTLSFSF